MVLEEEGGYLGYRKRFPRKAKRKSGDRNRFKVKKVVVIGRSQWEQK